MSAGISTTLPAPSSLHTFTIWKHIHTHKRDGEDMCTWQQQRSRFQKQVWGMELLSGNCICRERKNKSWDYNRSPAAVTSITRCSGWSRSQYSVTRTQEGLKIRRRMTSRKGWLVPKCLVQPFLSAANVRQRKGRFPSHTRISALGKA